MGPPLEAAASWKGRLRSTGGREGPGDTTLPGRRAGSCLGAQILCCHSQGTGQPRWHRVLADTDTQVCPPAAPPLPWLLPGQAPGACPALLASETRAHSSGGAQHAAPNYNPSSAEQDGARQATRKSMGSHKDLLKGAIKVLGFRCLPGEENNRDRKFQAPREG